ncbi:23S rRNA (uracil(1939)-C(5))-methyltransferase RlmD [Proteiniclasticum sp.]|uniref:23S rRNA (uracil(1939)-C(5))-methyltransferase RlmD n=1 Tax=Proteiniclasticum sp. TaxID=2053595 RepID=UPI00289839D4|nr:23S rRNA (uracil(1939)-C(5))-methyltransferase RlmD [Proteiniclasticum sp.]
MKKNEEHILKIVDQGHTGEGIGKTDHYPVFVDFALPEEMVNVKILKANKNYGFGKIMEIMEVSPERVEPPCPYYYRCGGCHIMHSSYEGQLKFKKKRVKDSLERIGKIGHVEIEDTIGMENPFRYRNKVQIPLGRLNGKFISGFYARRSHRIVDIESCIVQHIDGDYVLNILRDWAEEFNISTYLNDDVIDRKGILRHLMVRKGFRTGDLMVVLVVTKKEVPHLEVLLERLKKLDGFQSLLLNINAEDTNLVLGRENILIFGKPVIEDYIGPFKFKISPHSFFQVNPVQTEVMYEKALEYAGLTGEETVFDCYCGAGTISLFLSQKAKKVYGIEIVPQAIEDAKVNARENHVENVDFLVGKSEEVIVDLINDGIKADIVVVDPPRKGCDIRLLEAIKEIAPEKVVYVSCDPGSLGRDLGILESFGFHTEKVTPIDNFPNSYHVETVVLMSRVEK